VNAVSLGPTLTEVRRRREGIEQLAAKAPAGRPATADEIAEAIVFLATDRASFIHGSKLAGRWRAHRHLNKSGNSAAFNRPILLASLTSA
jgi:NAD(P)-dependent dehydrogenase (short-subunit alcohol dehydrogenase family)